MRVLIGRARQNMQFLFLFVNSRLEGDAPLTILSLVDQRGRNVPGFSSERAYNRLVLPLQWYGNGLSFGSQRAHHVGQSATSSTMVTPPRKREELHSQMALPDSATADFLVSRALLRRGRVYEDAVKMFQPYRETQDENPEARDSMRVLIGRARKNKQFLFLFVNNRLEGNAPLTILSLVDK